MRPVCITASFFLIIPHIKGVAFPYRIGRLQNTRPFRIILFFNSAAASRIKGYFIQRLRVFRYPAIDRIFDGGLRRSRIRRYIIINCISACKRYYIVPHIFKIGGCSSLEFDFLNFGLTKPDKLKGSRQCIVYVVGVQHGIISVLFRKRHVDC